MTRYFCILVSIVLLQFISSGEGLAMEGIVVKVIDGDSIKVLVDGIVKEVRLYGIDTPEYRQPYSNKAKQLTKRLADKQLVTIVTKDIDRYGRTVGVVFSRGKMVNRELVREGLAWFYQRYCLEQPLCGELKSLEAEARADQVDKLMAAVPRAAAVGLSQQRARSLWEWRIQLAHDCK